MGFKAVDSQMILVLSVDSLSTLDLLGWFFLPCETAGFAFFMRTRRILAAWEHSQRENPRTLPNRSDPWGRCN